MRKPQRRMREAHLFLYFLYAIVDRVSYLISFCGSALHAKGTKKQRTKHRENHMVENISLDDRLEFLTAEKLLSSKNYISTV